MSLCRARMQGSLSKTPAAQLVEEALSAGQEGKYCCASCLTQVLYKSLLCFLVAPEHLVQ